MPNGTKLNGFRKERNENKEFFQLTYFSFSYSTPPSNCLHKMTHQHKDDGEKDGMDMKSRVDESTRIDSMRLDTCVEWHGGVGAAAVMLRTISFL